MNNDQKTVLFPEPDLPQPLPLSFPMSFPMSFAQRRLWFLNELEPGTPHYNIPANIKIRGDLDIKALKSSIDNIVSRHEILFTTFTTQNNKPVQNVGSPCSVSIPILEPGADTPLDLEAWMHAQTQAELRLPFDLSAGPLLRFRLLKISNQEHILLTTMHHIISDAWSMGIFIREIAAFYKQHVTGIPCVLPELTIQYADFSEWQQDWLSGEALDQQLKYWQHTLADAPPILDLPLDRPRPKLRDVEGGSLSFTLTEKQSAQIKQLCQTSGATMFMTLLGVVTLLLSKYSRQDDIVIGSPVAGRNQSELENLIGFFVNTLVLRIDLSGELTFVDLLDRVKKTALGAFDHQDIPFEHLVEALKPERHLNINPLFQVSFTMQNAPGEDLELEGLSVQPFTSVKTGMSRFDLEFAFWEDEALHGSIVFKKDIFDAKTIDRMGQHLQTLLDAVIQTPEAKLADLLILKDAERKELLDLGSHKFQEFPEQPPLHIQFSDIAKKHPDRIALCFEHHQMTYQQLDEKSNGVAQNLLDQDIKTESLVGLYVERSLDTVVGILAILKAGAGYLPLDPAYQNDRLAFMIKDAKISAVLTHSSLLQDVQALIADTELNLLCIDKVEAKKTSAIQSSKKPNSLAYVIYTSGSTGTPKGVEITHNNVTRLFSSTRELFKFDENDVWTLFHSYAFDFSVWEIWGALLHGGKLVIVPYWTSRSPDDFYDLLHKESVTILNQTPSAFYPLIGLDERLNSAKPLALRTVIFGGEALDFQKIAPWFALHKDNQPNLINMFGITETTVHASYYRLSASDVIQHSSLIGCPLPDLKFYILDDHGHPVPTGIKGEIYVGGHGLARGYLNRSDLTKQRFVTDPFGTGQDRLYKSGDLGRWLADGNLEYCGRMDDQIQIRGFRVELGEIETVLTSLPAIQDVKVLYRTQENGGDLAAYVVANTAQGTFPLQDVRTHLKEKLPNYMCPGDIFILREMPLTTHGKIDQKALLKLKQEAPSIATARPTTTTEITIATIWCDVMGVDEIGIHDNFFERGGHSLLATQVVTRIREQLSTPLILRAFFENPTISGLAVLIDGQGHTQELKIPVADRTVDIPLSFAQERLWFIQELEGELAESVYNIPAAYRLRGTLNTQALEQALNKIIERHEVLRTTFFEQHGKPFQRIQEHLFIPLTVTNLPVFATPQDEDQNVHSLAAAHAQEKFDLTNGPLVRWKLLRLENGEHILLVSMHHIISDGWSTGIIAEETSKYYDEFSQGAAARLPDLAVQYADFSAWQRDRFADGSLLKEQIKYWTTRLEGAPPVLDLPCRNPRPPQQTYQGKIASFDITPTTRLKLEKLGQGLGATPFMTILSAFSLLLSRYGAGDDIIIGSPISNRGNRDLEQLIGFFVNTLVFRIDLSDDPTFRTLLGQVKNQALDAYTHQDLPFEKLIKALAPQRNLSYAPVFQVMLVVQNEPLGNDQDNPNLVIDTVAVDTSVSHFDMILYLNERDGGYLGMLEYASDLFDEDVIENFIQSFQTLLGAIADAPDLALSTYPLAVDLVVPKPKIVPQQIGLEELFEQQAAKTAEDVALVFEGSTLTYGELNAQSNRLAHFLKSKGVQTDVIVGLMMERSPALIVTLLAIIKAGGAYLPLDPNYPEDRTRTMVKDSKATLVLTDQGDTSLLIDGLEVIDINDIKTALETFDETNPVRTYQPSDGLAYVLYTSGSTGTPKGVEMGRAAVSNLIHWHLDHDVLSPPCPVLQFAPFTFDVAFQEVFSTLCSGGILHIASNEMRQDGVALLNYINDENIQRVFLPYVALQQLATISVERNLFPSPLKDIITAGEQLRISPAITQLFTALKTCRLHNHYGPCESHVVTTFTLEGTADNWPLLPSIGQPIANTEIYILDALKRPVPMGVPGELFIGGIALARGYLGQAKMTAERFIPHVFQERSGACLYRTGDLALWQADGNIKFLGRADNQVKIRGFRIEPGEIEALINAHPDVDDSVVIDIEFGPDDRRLAAYVTAKSTHTLDCVKLRQHLKSKLPEYMVPSALVVVEALPLTSSGKIDRNKLPPIQAQNLSATISAPPSSPVEQVLAAIWTEVLKIDNVGVQDNFFESGGHSLLATQMISRIREAFSIDIQVRKIFETPTLADLAQHIETMGKDESSNIPPIVPVERTGIHPLSFAQERLWFLNRLEGNNANYNMSAVIKITGDLNVKALSQSLSEIIRRHEVLRTNFKETDGQPHAIITPYEQVGLPVIDLGATLEKNRGTEIQRIIGEETLACFDLEKDSLLKTTLLNVPATAAQDRLHILILSMHHIVADNWSSGVFTHELTLLYDAFNQADQGSDTPFISPFNDLEIQYLDFAHWQRNWLTGDALDTQLSYWRTQLSGVPPVLQISPRSSDTQNPAPCQIKSFSLSPDLTAQVKKLCLNEGVSLYMGLLAAYAALLFRYTGREDILIGSPIANRNYKEIEPLIGFFVNTLPLRVSLANEPSYRALLRQVRTVALEAFAHQDLPFERIVQAVCPDHGNSRMPLVQVIFALQNAPAADDDAHGIQMSLMPAPSGPAKFDLILSMTEEGGQLHGVFEYDSRLFSAEEIEKMAEHFLQILSNVTTTPDERVVDILLTADNRSKTKDDDDEFDF